MVLDVNRVRNYLKNFQFEPLFIEELGWDRLNSLLEISVDNRSFNLSAVAHKHGFAVFVCPLDKRHLMVDETIRKMELKIFSYF